MKLVLDANILFAALIKDSLTAELLFDDALTIYAPEFLITEFLKYEELILKKTHRTRTEFSTLMHYLDKRIEKIPEEETRDHIEEATRISPDENDAAYFAAALRLDCAIWSNDKRLKDQEKVKIYSTKELFTGHWTYRRDLYK